MKNKLLIATGLTAVFIAACLVVANKSTPKLDCVSVTVDFKSILATSVPSSTCVSISGEQSALDVVTEAGYKITGTDKYGNQIVCLVNEYPKKADCSDMPPENAYWAVLVKRPGVVSEWGWADKGIADLQLETGDSVALVYTVDGKVRWPK